MKKLHQILLAIAIVCMASAPMYAQSSRGVVTGVVQDASGAVVAGADVTLTSIAQGTVTTLKTNSSGIYRFDGVDVGDYTVGAVATGFNKSETPATVAVGATVGRDFRLVVGSSTNTVEVSANNQELQTEDAVRGSTITAVELTELPISGQNSLNLILTNPGVARSNQGGSLDSGIGAVNGARARSNNFLLDGIQNNDISVAGAQYAITNNDELAEINFQTSNFSPEFGRAGGAVVSQITKSGTNQYHGTIATVYRSQLFNASTQTQRNAFISNSATYNTAIANGNLAYPVPQLKPKFHENIPAITFGGPLTIPHIYNGHDKTFIFGAAQWDRLGQNTLTTFGAVPTAAGVATLQPLATSCPNVANFLSFLAANGNPLGNSTGVGVGTISIAVPASTLANAPTCNGTARTGQTVQYGQFYRQAQDTYLDHNHLIRIDHHASEKQDMLFRWIFDDSNDNLGGTTGISSQFDVPALSRTMSGAFNDVYQVRNNLVNEFRFGYTRNNLKFNPPAANTLANTLPTIGITTLSTLQLSSTFPQGRTSNTFEYEDALTYVKGRHAFKGGVDITRQLAVQVAPFNGRGAVAYNTQTVTTFTSATQITGLANFVDNYGGNASTVSVSFGTPVYRPNLFNVSFFLQDTWKASPDLTLVYGFRYENFGQPANIFKYPSFAGFGVNDITSGAKVDQDNNNIGPTFGFSYNPHNGGGLLNGRTVIRGGYQVSYDTFYNNLLSNLQAGSPNSLANNPIITTSTAAAPRGLAGISAILPGLTPVPVTPYSNVTSVLSKHLRNPYYHHVSLGVQEQLPGRVVLDVAYVGTLGRQLFFTNPLNPALPNATFTQVATQTTASYGTQTLRLNPNRGLIQIRDGGLTSNYHALQVKISHQGLTTPIGRFYFTSSYTWSKSMDVLSETFATNSSPQNPSRSPIIAGPLGYLDYGPSDNDRTHISSTVINYNIRGPQAGIMKRVFGGWSAAPILTVQSGTPYTVVNGVDRDLDGSTIGDRVDIGNKNAPFNSRALVSAACPSGLIDGATQTCTTRDQVKFVQVTGYSPSSPFIEARNSNRTTRYLNMDANLLKKVAITERFNAELRGEFFNVTNNQNFDTPSANINITTTGGTSNFINTTLQNGGSRTFRVGAKILF